MSKELQSAEIGDLVKALVKAQKIIQHASKDSNNPHYKNDYASLESVIDATKSALGDNGLVIIQQPTFTEDGKSVLVTTLAHESGQWIRSFTPVLMEKQTAQGQGSGLTYARRYALAAIANISQTDDDGNEASKSDDKSKDHEPKTKASAQVQGIHASAGDWLIQCAKTTWRGKTIAQVVDQVGLPAFMKDARWWATESDIKARDDIKLLYAKALDFEAEVISKSKSNGQAGHF